MSKYVCFQYMNPQQSTWSRSYHNPVGTVYHAPNETEDRWATWDRKLTPKDQPDTKDIPPPRNYPLGYGLFNHMDNYGRRNPGIGLGAFLPRGMASQSPYVPMSGYSPYVASPEGSIRLNGKIFLVCAPLPFSVFLEELPNDHLPPTRSSAANAYALQAVRSYILVYTSRI